MKKIVILGSTGMLGSTVLEYFLNTNKYEVMGSIRDVRFANDNNFLFHPNQGDYIPYADYVINAIGIIKPHMMKDIKSSIYLNSIFPWNLADGLSKEGARLIHITTDCVFSGKDGNYNEESEHDALDDYGKSKSLGEPNNCMVLRTSIIGPEVHQNVSLVSWVQAQAGKDINGFTNHLWNGITTLQYAKICDQIISNDWYSEDLYHIHSPSIVNKFELVSMINDRYKVGANITPMKAPVVIDRTMSTKKDLCAKLNIPEIKDQIEEL
jgi:dTDP-4-dehydrorhamnose reductase